MIDIIVAWLVIVCLVGAFFEKGVNRLLLIIVAIFLVEAKFIPHNKLTIFLLVLTAMIIIIIDNFRKPRK